MRWLTVLPAITVLEFEKAHLNLGTGEGQGHLGFGWSMPEQPRPDRSFVWAMGG